MTKRKSINARVLCKRLFVVLCIGCVAVLESVACVCVLDDPSEMTDYLTDVYFVQLRDTRFLVSHNILRLFPQTMLRSLFPMGLSLLCQRLCTASEAGLLPQQDPDVPNASRVSSGSSSSSGWSRDLGQASDDTNDIDSDDSDDESEHFEHKDRMHYPFAKKLEPLDPSPPLHKLLVLDSDPHVFWFMTQSLLLIMLRNERIYTRMMRLDEMARKGSAWSLKDTNKGKANNGKDSRESLKVAKSYQGLAESALDPLATVLTFERKDSGTVLTDVRCLLFEPMSILNAQNAPD